MGGRRLGPHFWPPPGRPNVCEPTEAAYNDMTPGEKATLMLCELLLGFFTKAKEEKVSICVVGVVGKKSTDFGFLKRAKLIWKKVNLNLQYSLLGKKTHVFHEFPIYSFTTKVWQIP